MGQDVNPGGLAGEELRGLANEGVRGVSPALAGVGGVQSPIGQAAGAYITSIITGDQSFDAGVLHQVVTTLSQGTANVSGAAGQAGVEGGAGG